jgi:hypothetical protein
VTSTNEFDSDLIYAYGMTCGDLPTPHVTSMRLTCDLCGSAIWISVELIAKMTKLMLERPQASIVYACIGHHAEDEEDADIIEYGCPAPECSFICSSINMMADHFHDRHHHGD